MSVSCGHLNELFSIESLLRSQKEFFKESQAQISVFTQSTWNLYLLNKTQDLDELIEITFLNRDLINQERQFLTSFYSMSVQDSPRNLYDTKFSLAGMLELQNPSNKQDVFQNTPRLCFHPLLNQKAKEFCKEHKLNVFQDIKTPP